MSEEFVGRGIAFPLRLDATGGLALVEREREIAGGDPPDPGDLRGRAPDAARLRLPHPRLHLRVARPGDARAASRYEVRESLRRWEPRIEVGDVVVAPDPDEPSTLFIDISYSIKGTNDPRNLVFPFYTIPDERPVERPARGRAPPVRPTRARSRRRRRGSPT